jgi:hypothetical protein
MSVTTDDPRRGCLAALLTLCALPSARAEPPPLADLAGREPPVPDLAPALRGRAADAAADARATVSLGFEMAHGPERRDYGGSLLLTVPADLVFSRAKAKTVAPAAPPAAPTRAPPAESLEAPVWPVPRVTPADARAAAEAALRHAPGAGAGERLDALTSRARWSAVLPQLRLRATRLIDETESYVPTSYDPHRTTASGGASLWLEARGTWTLDRLVFAGEEVDVERMRRQLAREQEERAEHALELLFGWQRAMAALADPTASHAECLSAWVREQELSARLHVATGGWFTRWKAERVAEEPSCTPRSQAPPAPPAPESKDKPAAPKPAAGAARAVRASP